VLATACVLTAPVSRAQDAPPGPQPDPAATAPTANAPAANAPTASAPAAGSPAPAAAAPVEPALSGGTISDIKVEGNQRIETATVLSYMLVQPGDPFSPERLDRSLKTLYATGLFSDVNLRRDGSTLIVRVTENPIINRVVFEGNRNVTDEQLRSVVTLRSRSVFTPALAQADRQRILDYYAKRGRFAATVEPKTIDLSQNRVDLVFEVHEGAETYISRIAFVGNHAFSEDRLREVINSRESRWWRFLSTSDSYDADRVAFDKELLRRFYLANGYADFEVSDVAAELAPDKSAFFVTFNLREGERYRIGKVSVNTTLPRLDTKSLMSSVELAPGDWYDGDAVERTVSALNTAVQQRGYPFVDVKPRISRDRAKHTVDLVFDIGEAPRVYVERIDINGNTRTKDKVIRREFRLAEGDAFNAELVRRSRQRLQDLGYFNSVQITSQPGSAPDRVILDTAIAEKATGELTIGGGYSSDAGALANVGLREKNLVGTGIDAGIDAVLAQLRSELDLSVTDPYFLDRNLVAGFDLFYVTNNNQDIAQYDERRAGGSLRLGYEFTDHLRQAWTYSLVQRDIYNVATGASLYVQDEAGQSLLSQIGTTLTLDYRDSTVDPHSGYVLRGGADFAGLGGDVHYVRTKMDGTYFVPLDQFTGDTDWGVAVSGGIGYLFTLGYSQKIIDNFFLGGDNLRGFQSGGAGPHAEDGGDSLGGTFIWTQSTELHFPLPISPDIGLSGRAFVDVGALTGVTTIPGGGPVTDYASPRVGAGVGVSWKTPFGLINIDVAEPVVKKPYDQTQLFRFGFGTRF
jgi:outer membrane protein insertion porin family